MNKVLCTLKNSSECYTFKYGFGLVCIHHQMSFASVVPRRRFPFSGRQPNHIYARGLFKQSFSRCKCRYQVWATFKSSCKSKNCDLGNKLESAIESCGVNPASWQSLWVVVIKRNSENPDLIKTERLMLFHQHLWAKRDRSHCTELGFHYRLKCSKLCCGTPRMDRRRFPATGDVVI